MPSPSSSTVIEHSAPGVLGDDGDPPDARLALQPVPDRVLHQRLDAQERHRHGQHLGRDPQRDLQLVAEAGPLQGEVAVDRAQLLGEGGVVAVPPEGVAGEVGEVDQELPGPLRVGPHERGDRREEL